jgi:hypothetical protein
MRRYLSLLPALALGACVSATPLVDMTDVDPVVYQRALDDCEAGAYADANAAGPILAGAIIGATIGMGAGAVATSASTTMSAAEGYGAAAGTVAGGGTGAALGHAPAAATDRPQTVAECISARGYKLVGTR